ncbi:uncharacterized protein BT62DRAFT_1012921 [Guyanagaster necrorhizus]|uniref:Secreted protein n=1 Tax=Guyanagaster necrorhizus TaxID=856835 RepID=A0A9P7VGR4_9AGAR|nr:uncharacterized protein BT62DRAFT_1012921 [Guyanagaster necrorhizus MCA 3950]KAG7440262.1 hypothetical protein BT62DRAFT_1012921 [Guyanagaster necrorhizus MCA 3950]
MTGLCIRIWMLTFHLRSAFENDMISRNHAALDFELVSKLNLCLEPQFFEPSSASCGQTLLVKSPVRCFLSVESPIEFLGATCRPPAFSLAVLLR